MMRGFPDVMNCDRHEINKKYISGLSKKNYKYIKRTMGSGKMH